MLKYLACHHSISHDATLLPHPRAGFQELCRGPHKPHALGHSVAHQRSLGPVSHPPGWTFQPNTCLASGGSSVENVSSNINHQKESCPWPAFTVPTRTHFSETPCGQRLAIDSSNFCPQGRNQPGGAGGGVGVRAVLTIDPLPTVP